MSPLSCRRDGGAAPDNADVDVGIVDCNDAGLGYVGGAGGGIVGGGLEGGGTLLLLLLVLQLLLLLLLLLLLIVSFSGDFVVVGCGGVG